MKVVVFSLTLILRHQLLDTNILLIYYIVFDFHHSISLLQAVFPTLAI